MSELDSIQCRGITEENKARGENEENAENSKPSKDNEINRGDSEDINEVFDDKYCGESLFLRSTSLHLKKKIQFVRNDLSMESPLTKKTNRPRAFKEKFSVKISVETHRRLQGYSH